MSASVWMSPQPQPSFRAPRSPARCLLILLVLLVVTAAAAEPARRPAERTAAGAADTAVVAIWPPASTADELRQMRLLLETLVSQSGGEVSTRIFLPLEGGIAAGAALPGASSSEARALAENLLRPPPVEERHRQAAVATLEHARRAVAADPLAQGRALLLAQLFPARPGEWWLETGAVDWKAIGAASLDRLAERVRRAPPRLRVSGPAPVRERVASLVDGGSAPPDETDRRPESPLPIEVLTLRGATAGDGAVLVGLAFDAGLAGRHAAALPLLAELLREGEGSLDQRLAVAVGPGADSYVELLATGEGGGALLLGVRAAPADLAPAWRLLEGTLSSISAQPFRSDALLRARQRLDRLHGKTAGAPGDRLRSELLLQGWGWPPADRWKTPPGPAAVLAAAAELLARAGRSRCAVLPEKAPLASLPAAFSAAAPLEAAGLCPDRADLLCAGAGAAQERTGLAAELLRSLSGDRLAGTTPSFTARYRVREETPIGPSTAELTLEVSGEEVRSSWGPGRHALRLSAAAAGDTARVDAADETELPAAALDGLELLVLREPVVLTATVLAGALPARERELACPAGRCPALAVELAQGTRLALVLDPGAHLPREARVWWPGTPDGAPPDARMRYSRWQEASGVRVAGRVTTAGDLGDRVFELLEWRLMPAAAPLPPR